MEEMMTDSLGTFVQLKTDYESALAQTVAALKSEGFGVLTEIDVKATLKTKLGVDFAPYKILGACNPPLAYRSLTAAPEVGLLLPCNVTVRQVTEDTVEVALVNPLMMLSVVNNPALKAIAEEAGAKLARVAEALRK
jgi:uncharacterized protein (DUF302 family)